MYALNLFVSVFAHVSLYLGCQNQTCFYLFCENARSSQQAPFDNKAYRVTWKSKVSRMKFTHHIADHALIEN